MEQSRRFEAAASDISFGHNPRAFASARALVAVPIVLSAANTHVRQALTYRDLVRQSTRALVGSFIVRATERYMYISQRCQTRSTRSHLHQWSVSLQRARRSIMPRVVHLGRVALQYATKQKDMKAQSPLDTWWHSRSSARRWSLRNLLKRYALPSQDQQRQIYIYIWLGGALQTNSVFSS